MIVLHRDVVILSLEVGFLYSSFFYKTLNSTTAMQVRNVTFHHPGTVK